MRTLDTGVTCRVPEPVSQKTHPEPQNRAQHYTSEIPEKRPILPSRNHLFSNETERFRQLPVDCESYSAEITVTGCTASRKALLLNAIATNRWKVTAAV